MGPGRCIKKRWHVPGLEPGGAPPLPGWQPWSVNGGIKEGDFWGGVGCLRKGGFRDPVSGFRSLLFPKTVT